MSFLIFVNSNYGLFIELFLFEASLYDFLILLNCLTLGVFGVIFEFLKFSKMSLLIFFNSNYSLFSELFWFKASLYDFLNFLNFLSFRCFWGHFCMVNLIWTHSFFKLFYAETLDMSTYFINSSFLHLVKCDRKMCMHIFTCM